ncbi:hypothetical protein [Roseovarius sp. D22-M7]|uniref:hypothetical protein n=1 Tax=Roseovarius sp. D22-M7 TaxID=3127116 RepID=UPI00300FB264
MRGLGVLYVLLGGSAICAGLAVFGHIAGWPNWALGLLWLLALPALWGVVGMIAGLTSPRR